MSSINRVGSSCLASSHMLCTHACALRFANFAFCPFTAGAASTVMVVAAATAPVEAESLADIAASGAVNVSSQPRCFFGTGFENSSTNSTCPPNPHVSLKRHHAKIDG